MVERFTRFEQIARSINGFGTVDKRSDKDQLHPFDHRNIHPDIATVSRELFDDGHYSGVRMLEILADSDISLAEMIDKYPQTFSTPELNISVDENDKFGIVDAFKEKAVFCHLLLSTVPFAGNENE